MIEDPEREVYGILYDVEGEVASQLQFFLTDSTDYFFRGALYFNCRPNPDSLAPVLNFIHSDVEKLIETITWNTSSRKGQFDLKK